MRHNVFTDRVKSPGRFSLRRRPGLVVKLPPCQVPPLLLGGHESLAAVLANQPRRPREAEAFPLPLLHLGVQQFSKREGGQELKLSFRMRGRRSASAMHVAGCLEGGGEGGRLQE